MSEEETVEELTDEELENKYLTLGKIFEEIIQDEEASRWIKLHFDISVEPEESLITVTKLTEGETTRRLLEVMQERKSKKDENKIIVPDFGPTL